MPTSIFFHGRQWPRERKKNRTIVHIRQTHAPQPFSLQFRCVHYVLQTNFPLLSTESSVGLQPYLIVFNKVSSFLLDICSICCKIYSPNFLYVTPKWIGGKSIENNFWYSSAVAMNTLNRHVNMGNNDARKDTRYCCKNERIENFKSNNIIEHAFNAMSHTIVIIVRWSDVGRMECFRNLSRIF